MSFTLRLLGDDTLRPAVAAAARLLSDAVSLARDRHFPVRLFMQGEADVVILSLTDLVEDDTPVPALAPRVHDTVVALLSAGARHLIVPTLLRHAAPPDPARVARLRRLNALAVDLSRVHGCEVADLDHALGRVGALPLGCDWRAQGERAAHLAGRALAAAILARDLAPDLDPAVQSEARIALEQTA